MRRRTTSSSNLKPDPSPLESIKFKKLPKELLNDNDIQAFQRMFASAQNDAVLKTNLSAGKDELVREYARRWVTKNTQKNMKVIVEDFTNWLLGKHPEYNKEDPDKLKDPTWWGRHRLVGKEIDTYLENLVYAHSKFTFDLWKLRHNVPTTMNDAWAYFIFFVRKNADGDDTDPLDLYYHFLEGFKPYWQPTAKVIKSRDLTKPLPVFGDNSVYDNDRRAEAAIEPEAANRSYGARYKGELTRQNLELQEEEPDFNEDEAINEEELEELKRKKKRDDDDNDGKKTSLVPEGIAKAIDKMAELFKGTQELIRQQQSKSGGGGAAEEEIDFDQEDFNRASSERVERMVEHLSNISTKLDIHAQVLADVADRIIARPTTVDISPQFVEHLTHAFTQALKQNNPELSGGGGIEEDVEVDVVGEEEEKPMKATADSFDRAVDDLKELKTMLSKRDEAFEAQRKQQEEALEKIQSTVKITSEEQQKKLDEFLQSIPKVDPQPKRDIVHDTAAITEAITKVLNARIEELKDEVDNSAFLTDLEERVSELVTIVKRQDGLLSGAIKAGAFDKEEFQKQVDAIKAEFAAEKAGLQKDIDERLETARKAQQTELANLRKAQAEANKQSPDIEEIKKLIKDSVTDSVVEQLESFSKQQKFTEMRKTISTLVNKVIRGQPRKLQQFEDEQPEISESMKKKLKEAQETLLQHQQTAKQDKAKQQEKLSEENVKMEEAIHPEPERSRTAETSASASIGIPEMAAKEAVSNEAYAGTDKLRMEDVISPAILQVPLERSNPRLHNAVVRSMSVVRSQVGALINLDFNQLFRNQPEDARDLPARFGVEEANDDVMAKQAFDAGIEKVPDMLLDIADTDILVKIYGNLLGLMSPKKFKGALNEIKGFVELHRSMFPQQLRDRENDLISSLKSSELFQGSESTIDSIIVNIRRNTTIDARHTTTMRLLGDLNIVAKAVGATFSKFTTNIDNPNFNNENLQKRSRTFISGPGQDKPNVEFRDKLIASAEFDIDRLIPKTPLHVPKISTIGKTLTEDERREILAGKNRPFIGFASKRIKIGEEIINTRSGPVVSEIFKSQRDFTLGDLQTIKSKAAAMSSRVDPSTVAGLSFKEKAQSVLSATEKLEVLLNLTSTSQADDRIVFETVKTVDLMKGVVNSVLKTEFDSLQQQQPAQTAASNRSASATLGRFASGVFTSLSSAVNPRTRQEQERAKKTENIRKSNLRPRK